MTKQVSGSKHSNIRTGRKITKAHDKKVKWEFPLIKQNFLMLGIGVAAIALGYILMATAIGTSPALPHSRWDSVLAVYIAPIIISAGYCVLIPLGLLKLYRSKNEDND